MIKEHAEIPGGPFKLVADLMASFDPHNPFFRPTEICNEGWLLKAFLHQLSKLDGGSFPLSFAPDAQWFSEALLPTAFKPRYRGDRLGEGWTNADGVIGHIQVGKNAKADLKLRPDPEQFVVIEAKIWSRLSASTHNAQGFDQAARNVACMAEVLRRGNVWSAETGQIAFVVLAPQAAIDAHAFSTEMNPQLLRKKVQNRVAAYEGVLDLWYEEWFEPTMEAIKLHSISWEDAIKWVQTKNAKAADSLYEFYQLCLAYN